MHSFLQSFWQYAYLFAAFATVFSIKWLSHPSTARRGVIAGEIGFALAIVGTFLRLEVSPHHYISILIAIAIGAMIGAPMARLMPMTAVPQFTALSHAFGSLAAALVGTAEYYLTDAPPHGFTIVALIIEVLLGFLTFTASLMAFGKLQGLVPSPPITYKGQNFVNLAFLAFGVVLGLWPMITTAPFWVYPAFVVVALIFGVMFILPIGGGDMPTVIALLNSFAGASACAMGFTLGNQLLIIAGALNAASGFTLSVIMCKAMNRSFTNVLFGAFGKAQEKVAGKAETKPVHSATAEDAAMLLLNSSRVIIAPGYGMAVSQAQHKVRELADQLIKRGIDVQFAIHPVAGRMPGHMNVLLAEADIPYDRLHEMEDINNEFPETDVALVIGANDVVNPAARHDKTSAIYGMPILDVDKARHVMVIKRSMNTGFAGIENELYYDDKTLMLFGDAKGMVAEIVKQVGAQAPVAV